MSSNGQATARVHDTRIRPLNALRIRRGGDFVLYWMQQSQRAEHNDALEYAIQRANSLRRPLMVCFGLMDGYPGANLRHYRFMLEGLTEVRDALARRGVGFTVRRGDPADVAIALGKDAVLIVCDRGYTRHQKAWRARVAREAECALEQVECDVVVPVEVASDKAEHAARTIRPKLRKHWDAYLAPLRTTPLDRTLPEASAEGIDLGNLDYVLAALDIDRSVAPVPLYKGGTRQARRLLERFLREAIVGYRDHRNQPHTDAVSHMSKYLHFGQISPVYLACRIREASAPDADRDAYLEELLVRRELAQNFVNFTKDYDRYRCLPAWARGSLDAHRGDRREHVYTRKQLISGATHDRYWNAAMREMRFTGYMHNHMRMYWGKKIIEWSTTPEHAHRVAMELNNKYLIDGRDPSSFANVNWLFGLHDRPWPERPVFGKVRYMAASGLERKTEPEEYVEKVDRLVREVESSHGEPRGGDA
jgi:deoxyribodipyrimidine photo-lyase